VRYYDIEITDPASGKQLLHYTSHPRGVNAPPDPGALQVEIDILELFEGQAAADSLIRIYGIPFKIISSASDFALKNCVVKGGMGKGLPLANPRQAGQIGGGQIKQAFGNWVGTEMMIDLLIQPGLVKEAKTQEPRNLTVQWPPSQPMSTMIDTTLKSAYPELKRDINISDKLKLPNTEVGFYSTLPQFAQYSKNLSRKILGPNSYAGVEMVVRGDTIHVTDGTKASTAKEVRPTDLIGQPTWIAPQTVQVILVMRGDIKVGNFIKLPDSLLTTRASSFSTSAAVKMQTAFKGTFWVQHVRHVGSFRQPDGRSWTTIVDAMTIPEGGFNPNDRGPGYGVQTGPRAT
jgi:hypothetical protein